MKSFDIDLFDPGYPPPRKVRKVNQQRVERERRVFVQASYSNNKVGVQPEKLLNWRALERRTSTLYEMWKNVSNTFWDMSKALPRPRGTSKGWYETVVAVEEGGGKLLKFSDGGYSVDWTEQMMEELSKDPNCYGSFTFVPYDRGGRELGRLEHRMNRLIRAHGTYRMAFHRAVEDRLSKMRETRKIPHASYSYHEPIIFLITNEGRTHVVTSGTDGRFTWHEGEVHSTCENPLSERIR